MLDLGRLNGVTCLNHLGSNQSFKSVGCYHNYLSTYIVIPIRRAADNNSRLNLQLQLQIPKSRQDLAAGRLLTALDNQVGRNAFGRVEQSWVVDARLN